MKNIKNKKVILISILMMLLVGIVGTFAWLSWASNETVLKLTVGNIDNVRITLYPYRINSSITPTLTYDSGIYTSVDAINNKTNEAEFSLYYRINTIDNALVDDGFKYTILRSTDGSNYSEYKTGNFLEATSGGELMILEETVPASTTYLYKVYLWIDGSDGNQANMQGKIFDGELRANVISTDNIVADIVD